MRRRLAALACSCVLLAGCSSGHSAATASPASGASTSGTPVSGGSTGGSPTSAAAAPVAADTIIIKDFAFQPKDLTVAPGATVTVTDADSTAHTVTATVTANGGKAFDTGDIAPGGTATFTAPSTAGTYAYICEIHQYMQGSLTVR